ncbi:MAG: TolB family protein [Candidatus Polarisedimenticolia bacterium]
MSQFRRSAALAAALTLTACGHGTPVTGPDKAAGHALESSSIAYARSDGVYLARGDGRDERRLVDEGALGKGTIPFLAALAPDKRRVLFVSMSAMDPRTDKGGGLALNVLEIEDEEVRAWRRVLLDGILGGTGGAAMVEASMVPAAAWSPDSARIALALRRSARGQPDTVVVFDAEGTPRRSLDLQGRRLVAGSGLAWDGGEALLLAVEPPESGAQESAGPQIVRLPLEAVSRNLGGVQVVANGRDPAVSPDGSRLAVVESAYGKLPDIVLMDRDGHEVRRFEALPGRVLHHLFWSSDGRYLYYHSLASTGPLGIVEIGLLRCLDTTGGSVFDLVRLG